MSMELGHGQYVVAETAQVMDLDLQHVRNVPLVDHLNNVAQGQLYDLLNNAYKAIQRYCAVRRLSLKGRGNGIQSLKERHFGVNTLGFVGPSGGGKSVTLEQALRVFTDHAGALHRTFGFDLHLHYVSFSESALEAQVLGIIARSDTLRDEFGKRLEPGHRAYTGEEYTAISGHQRSIVDECVKAAKTDYEQRRHTVRLIVLDPSTATIVPGVEGFEGNNRGYSALHYLGTHELYAEYARAVAILPDADVVEASKRERDLYAQANVDSVSAVLKERGIVFQTDRNQRRTMRRVSPKEKAKIVASLKAYGASSKGIDRSHREQEAMIDVAVERGYLSQHSVEDYYHLVLGWCGIPVHRRVVVANVYEPNLVGVTDTLDGGEYHNQRHTYLAQKYSVVRQRSPRLLEELGITP